MEIAHETSEVPEVMLIACTGTKYLDAKINHAYRVIPKYQAEHGDEWFGAEEVGEKFGGFIVRISSSHSLCPPCRDEIIKH